MRVLTRNCVIWTVIAVGLSAREARADGYVNPWVGVNGVNDEAGHAAVGVTTGYMSGGVFGFEVDFGYTPHFLGSDDGFVKNTAMTFTGDFILGVPFGGAHGAGIRPFASAGLGLLRTHSETEGLAEVSRSNNELCYDVGGGVMGFFGEHIGLRGDLRYFRTVEDTNLGSVFELNRGTLRFWRVTGGVTFR